MLKHILIVSLLLTACASRNPDNTDEKADAGTTGTDGTVKPDAGHGADAGTTPDSAPTQPDAAQPQPDAGTQPDAAPQPDAGAQPDAAPPSDAPQADAPPADAPPVQATVVCSDSGSLTNVTVTGPVLAHVFNDAGLTPDTNWTIQFGYGGSDTVHWVSDTATYNLVMPSSTAGFNLVLRETNGVVHWFDVNGFTASGTCSQGNSEFTHTAGAATPDGSLSCTDTGSTTNLTLTGPIVAHVINNAGLAPNSNWTIRFGYGGSDSKHWVSDTASYALTMPKATTGFNLVLREPGGVDHWFDVNGFTASGTCSQGNSEFSHTAH